MAHGVKYRIQYYRLRSGGLTTIDILQRSYVGAITTLLGGASPFESSFEGNPNNIYESTMGSGAIINIVNTTPLSLLEFYTADPQEWKVQVWDGVTDTDSDASSDGGGVLRWQGFISPEIFSEGYSNPIASEMSVQCQDGMALLDKIAYKSTDLYTGKQTKGQIISNVLSKLELSFNVVITSNDIQVTDTNTNLFTDLELFNENFLDEGDEPKTCRWVLDSIIGGLGLVMFFRGDTIFVIDPINLHDTSKGKSYNPHTWGSEAAYAVGGYLDISNQDINWGKTGSMLDIVPAYSEVFVKYDPYNFTELTYQFSDEANWTADGTFVDQGGEYELNSTIDYKDWVVDSSSDMQIAMRETAYSAPEYVLQLADSKGEASYEFIRAVVTEDQKLCLRVHAQIYVNTKLDSANIFSQSTGHTITRLILPMTVKVGTQYWKGGTDWDSSEDSAGTDKWQPWWIVGSDLWADYLSSTINDKWVDAYIDIPLWNYEGDLLEGDVIVQLLDDMSYFNDQILPATEPFFTAPTTEAKTNTFGATGVSWARVTDSIIEVTITGLTTYLGVEDRRRLLDGAVKDVGTTVPSGTFVSITWHDASHSPTTVTSTVAETTFALMSYDEGTDVLIFRIETSGTPYFGVGYDHIDSGYITNVVYDYDYLAVRAFLKDLKLEIVNAQSRQNIGNNGVESKGVLSTNLTGKDPFTINTYCGIGPYGCSRGAFKSDKIQDVYGDSGVNIPGLYRGVNSTLYSTSQLILQSFMSQYKQPREKLIGQLNVFDQGVDIRTKLLKDTNHRPGKAFYIYKATYKDREEMMDIEAVEVTDTRETVA